MKKKRRGTGLEIKTIEGKQGTYIFFRTKGGSYHVLSETDAKEAAIDCGAAKEGNTRRMCKEVWDKN